MSFASGTPPVFADQITYSRNKIRWYRHSRVGGVLKCSLVLGHGLFVSLRLIMIKDPVDSFLVPAWRKMLRAHRAHLLRRRRSALLALGLSSYAVITKAESGAGSGT